MNVLAFKIGYKSFDDDMSTENWWLNHTSELLNRSIVHNYMKSK